MTTGKLLRHLTNCLESLAIPYLITGSVATSAHGVPRFTNDIDVVVELDRTHVAAIGATFPAPDFYWSAAAIEEAVRERSQFNILHPESGLKIDFMVASDSDFDRSRLARGVRQPTSATTDAVFASPEDVIIKKLEYFREGGSEKHLRDIVGVLKVQADRIDYGYLADWVARLDLNAEWQLVAARLGGK